MGLDIPGVTSMVWVLRGFFAEVPNLIQYDIGIRAFVTVVFMVGQTTEFNRAPQIYVRYLNLCNQKRMRTLSIKRKRTLGARMSAPLRPASACAAR